MTESTVAWPHVPRVCRDLLLLLSPFLSRWGRPTQQDQEPVCGQEPLTGDELRLGTYLSALLKMPVGYFLWLTGGIDAVMTTWQCSEAMVLETNPLTMLVLKALMLLSCAAVQTRLSCRAAARGCSSHMGSWLLSRQGVSTTFPFPSSAYRPKDVFIQSISKYFNNTDKLSHKKIPSRKIVFTRTCSTWACEQRNCTALAATIIFKPLYFFVQKLILISMFSRLLLGNRWPIRLASFASLFPCVLMYSLQKSVYFLHLNIYSHFHFLV